ncbi:MAG: hypothetical protein ACTSPB_02510 [Candidatus Thorarchaeota archaeon]
MTTYHGATVKLIIERLLDEGKIEKEYIGTLDGSGLDIDFYTHNFPITTEIGVTTDDETDVDVFTDDGTPGSWTEYEDDGSDFEIVGATGKVTIKADENQASNAGERISISYYTTAEVGEGQNASVDFDGGLEETHKLGSRNPQEIKEGPITISGTIGQLFCDQHLFGKFLGESDFYKKLADFSFYIYLDAPEGVIADGSPYIKVANAKFGGGSLTVDLGAIAALDVNYRGLAVSTGTYSA